MPLVTNNYGSFKYAPCFPVTRHRRELESTAKRSDNLDEFSYDSKTAFVTTPDLFVVIIY
jgi:hypothetical protein